MPSPLPHPTRHLNPLYADTLQTLCPHFFRTLPTLFSCSFSRERASVANLRRLYRAVAPKMTPRRKR
eukprot:3601131-Rhodomonas_salina.3